MNTTVTILSVAYNKYGDRIELLGDGDDFSVVQSYEGLYGQSQKILIHRVGTMDEGKKLFRKTLAEFRDLQSTRAA